MYDRAVFLKLLFLSLSFITTLSQTAFCNITTTNSYAGGTASHSIICSFQKYDLTTTDSYLVVGYSNNWIVSAVTKGNANDFCETSCTLSGVNIIINGNNIKVTGLFPNSVTKGYFSFRYTLNGIVNPTFKLTQAVSLSFYTSADALIKTVNANVNTNAAKMSCSASFTDPTLNTITPYTFTVNPGITLPSTGYLKMTFPSIWRNSLSGPTLSYTGCSGGTISCTQSGNVVTANNVIASSSSAPFTFTLSSVNNPSTEQINNDLLFAYYYSNNSQISYCIVPISGLSSPSLSGINFIISGNVGMLTYTNVLLSLPTDELLITLPPQVYIGNFIIANVYNGGSTTPKAVSPTIITGTNQISVAPYVSSTITNTLIQFNNIYLLQPATTINPTFSLRRNTHQYSYSSCCNLALGSSQTMTLQVTATNYILKASANYMITFIPTYYGIYYLVVDFGSAFSFTISNTYPCYIYTLTNSSSMVCTAITSTQINVALTTSSSLASLLGYASNYTLVLTGLTNPSEVTATMTLSSYYLPANQLEFSNVYTVTYITTLLSASVTSNSTQVGATASYSFTINNANSLLANSILHIYFPLSFTLAGISCTTNAVASTCNLVNTSYVQFTLPNTAIPSYTLSTYALTVLNVVNPNSLLPTASFGLALQSGSGVVEAVYDGVVIAMTALAHFTNLSVVPSTFNVGGLASYTINFAHSLSIAGSSVITLSFQLPQFLTLVSCTACSSFQTFTITSSTTSVVISGIYNPEQITVATNIIISLSVDGYLSIQDTNSAITYSSLTTGWSLKTNSTYLGDPINANLTIQALPLNTKFFVITIPSEYGLGTVTTATQGSFSCTCVLTSYTLNCSVLFLSSINATLILQGMINPTVVASSYWQISVYAVTAILISSESSTIKFIAACGANCRDCTNSSYCKSCYSNPLVNNLPYLNNSNNICLAGCSAIGQFLQGSICYSCHSSCLSCSLFSTNCTSCSIGSLLYNGSCLAQCPQTYYPSAQTCIACSNNCLTCLDATTCLTCATNYILQTDSTCLLTCPSGSFNSSKVCTTCPSNCLTCNTNGCLTCVATYLLTGFTSPSCVSACPTNTYISNSGIICEACQSPCATCSGHSNNCTSCQPASSNSFLSNFRCVGICPNQTYVDELNQCQACQSPCLNCNSLNKCTSCISPYLLYAATNQCLSTCFSNTINISGICVQCVSPCLTCSGTATTCTSCIQSYFYLSNSCTTSCTSPYIVNGNNCSLCYQPCLTCQAANPYHCLTCITSYFLFSLNCYSACPVGTYANTATTCALCSPPCYQCSSSASTCTGCFTGSFLFNNTCYSPCPPGYYQINTTCQLCEPQCLSCNHTSGDECSACSNPTLYYFNPVTYHCTISCIIPYYANTGSMVCERCQLPCQTCMTFSTACGSCYTGYFLKNQNCITSCGAGFYANSSINTCLVCPNLCATCDGQKCFTCTNGAYFFDGTCYAACPPQAPNIFGIYCRNCLRSNCIKCNTLGACTMCQPSTYNFNGDCLSTCPADYEPDLVTNSYCILRSDIAYFNYIKALESSKIWVMPSSIFLFLSIPLLYFAQVKLFCMAFCLGVPQMVSLVEFTTNYMRDWTYLAKPILPFWLMYAVFGAHLVCSVVYSLIVKKELEKDQSLSKLLNYGKNQFRYIIVVICSCFNKQILYLLFSGLFSLPFTSLKFKLFKGFYVLHAISLLLDVGVLAIGFLIVLYEKTFQYDYKLFYAAVDALVVYSTSLIFQILFLILLQNQIPPKDYVKYILPNVSNRSLPAVSIYNDELNEDNLHNNLHRSNSDDNMLESQEMKKIQFMSVLDPDDYHDETPLVPLHKIEEGVENGDFRKKNKKKRGQRRLGRFDLDIIEEEEEDIQKPDPKKKKKMTKNEDVGGLKNYMYWKKPKPKKANPGLVFHEHENEIMSRIKQKESQFDSITQHDIIFQDYNEQQDSSDDNYHIQEESRRALQKPIYDNYFNLNYASKKHLHDV